MKRTTKTKSKPPKPQPAPVWAVMKAHKWSGLSMAGIVLRAPAEGPQMFIPVFEKMEQAVSFNGGSMENVVMMEVSI